MKMKEATHNTIDYYAYMLNFKVFVFRSRTRTILISSFFMWPFIILLRFPQPFVYINIAINFVCVWWFYMSGFMRKVVYRSIIQSNKPK